MTTVMHYVAFLYQNYQEILLEISIHTHELIWYQCFQLNINGRYSF